MHRVVPWLAIGLVLASSPARAEPEAEAIRLVYDAPPGCPSASELEARVRASAPRVRVMTNDAPVRVFTVSVEEGASPRGRLTITKDGAVIGTRDVTGARCDEVASILAFAVALAVDPNATPRYAEDAPAAPIPTHEPAKPTGRVIDAPAIAAAPSASPTTWGLSVHTLAAGGLAPNPTLGGGISGELGAHAGALVPSFRLGVEYAESAPVSNDGARVTFADALAFLEACPTAWALGRLSLRPCARIGGGLRITASEGIPGAHSVTRPWLDLGATLHLRARIAGPVFVDLGGGPLFPLLRDRVYFSPDSPEFTVHEVPSIGARGEIGVGLAFP